MDVLLSVKKTCFCCGAVSIHPVHAAASAFDEGEPGALLDGAGITGRLDRGMQVCAACGYAAPDLQAAPSGMSASAVRDTLAGQIFRDGFRRRGAAEVTQASATRWLAYAAAFEEKLSPEQAGLAWVNAAAELELPRLHRIGGRDQAGAPEPEQADAARRRAVTHLMRVFDAEFELAGTPGLLPGLRRAWRRLRIGETALRPVRWSARDHRVADTSSEMRFEIACTLADLLRRSGEFVAARAVALRALHAGMVPQHLAETLSFQIRLCRQEDTVAYRHKDRIGTVVAFPVTAEPSERTELDVEGWAVAA